MWFLQSLNDSYHYLWEKSQYSVGRKNTDITISNDDSISRIHALVEIENNIVYVTDKGSKYGTFIGNDKLKANERKQLNENTHIKFGLLKNEQSEFILKRNNLKIITSNIKHADKQQLKCNLEFLNATYLPTWSRLCTHVVTGEAILTVKVLSALIQQQYIVTVKYFEDYVNAVKSNSSLPDPKTYLTEFKETLVSNKMNLEYNPKRKKLFSNKVCVFLTEHFRKQMNDLIIISGGRATSWEKEEIPLSELKSKASSHIFIQEHSQNYDSESESYKSFCEAVKYLSKLGKRSIPFSEIAMAIVHCSLAEYCNPDFKRIELLRLGNTPPKDVKQIFAYDTQNTANEPLSQNQEISQSQRSLNVVGPSYETDTPMTSQTCSIKRLFNADNTDKPAKKLKEDQLNVFTSTSHFSFSKSSNQTNSGTKSSLFGFQKCTNMKNATDKQENNELIENPFSRKRKATDTLKTTAKKKPLGNISNLTSSSVGTISLSKNVSLNKNTLTECKSWLKHDDKKEIKEEQSITSVKEIEEMKGLDSQVEEILLINSLLKDTVVITSEPMFTTKGNNSNVTFDNKNNTGVNFKRFKKKQQYIQTTIFSEEQLIQTVVSGNNIVEIDDENVDNDEDDIGFAKPTFQKNQKRIFKYAA